MQDAGPSTSSGAVRRKQPTPKFDSFASKKLKSIDENDEDIKKIGQKLLQTLDGINQTINKENKEEENGSLEKVNYRKLLSDAVGQIPPGKENEFLEIILQDLEEFDNNK